MNGFESFEDGIITWQMPVSMLCDEEEDNKDDEDDRPHYDR